MQLYDYQKAGRDFLAGRRTALLADDPRLGKTVQTIHALDAAMVLKVLIVAPAGVTENWRREVQKLRRGDWSAFITSYEKAAGSDYARLLAQEWDVLVIDEAHMAKSITAKRTVALYGKGAECGPDALASRAAQVWILTGTPMLNHAGEMFTHLRALHPEAVMSERTGRPWTIHQFEQAYCRFKATGFGNKIVGSKNEDKLHAKLQGFMLRRRKADVLKHLPPLEFEDLWIEGDVTGLPGDEIEIVRKALAERGIEGLRVIAANGSVATLRRLTGMAKVPGMRTWLREWLESRPVDEKIVVFAHHHDVVESLYDGVHTAFVRVNKFSKKHERQAAIDRFKEDPAVRGIICRMSAEGVGISLARSSEMVVVEPSWVPKINEQVYERIVDIGKTDPCLVRTAIIANSIDEDIQRACIPKSQSFARIIDGENVA